MQDSSSHARQASLHWKSPQTTFPANAGLSPVKRRGPGHPWKYAESTEANRMAADCNIQANIQASVNASLI